MAVNYCSNALSLLCMHDWKGEGEKERDTQEGEADVATRKADSLLSD